MPGARNPDEWLRRLRRPLAVLAALGALTAQAEPPEPLARVELIPQDRAGWSGTHLFAPITGLFLGGPGYWYSPREVEIRTTPPGASLDLFYVRRGFQKAYAPAEAPVVVVLPSRIQAGSRDVLTIRAFLDGHRQTELKLKVRSRDDAVRVELEPLSNRLVAVAHRYLAGRVSVDFLTLEAPTFRMQQREGVYSLILVETVGSPDAAAGMSACRDPLLSSLRPQQLGEDLVVRIALTPEAQAQGASLRSRQAYDAVRRLHRFSLDVVPADGAADAVRRAQQALARIVPGDVSGCATRFDAELRERLEPSELARALAPRGAFTDPYLRAAMKRLGEVSPGGRVELVDGTGFQPAVPLELAAAASQAAEVQGYLALLRRFVALLEPEEHRRETLRGLVAPELSPDAFASRLEAAEAAERSCRAASGAGPA